MAHALRPGHVPLRASAPLVHKTSASKSTPQTLSSPLLTGPLALKEWAVACEALQNGDQTIVLRKGGIMEGTFKPEASHFYLFPTAFHVARELVRVEFREQYKQAMLFDPKQQVALRMTHYAEVTGAWATASPEVVAALSELHVWGEEFLEARLKWRAQQPLTVMELRMHCLPEPVELPLQEGYFGCFSWVDLSKASLPSLPLHSAKPVLSGEQFAAKQLVLRQQLERTQLLSLDVS